MGATRRLVNGHSPHNMRRMARYIHQRREWPVFTWSPGELALPLSTVRFAQGRLLGKMAGLGLVARSETAMQAVTDEVMKSSEIEGEKLNRAHVRSSVARRLGLDIGGLPHTDRHVEGVVEMILDATQRYREPLDTARLFDWHAALFPTGRSGMRRLSVGAWRPDTGEPMQVVSGPLGAERVHFEAPKALRIEAEMRAFLDWFNGSALLDPLIVAGLAHLWFVTIHPFEDGNGRIARAVADMALARSEDSASRFYSMSSQIRRERKTYYRILETTQKGSLDVTPWLAWFLACLGRAVGKADDVVQGVVHRSHFWERISGAPINERQRKVLQRLLDGFEGKLTSSKWAKLADCSQDTASRDIADLIDRGILVKDSAGGRSTSYSLVV